MARWSPWRAARRIPNLEIRLAELPRETGGGVLVRRGDRIWILLERTLSQRARRCVLGHELVHLERGSSARCARPTPSWAPLIAREELVVDRIVAARLVPDDELFALVRRHASMGQPVLPLDVEEEFDVDHHIAELALERLARRWAA